MDYTPNPVAHEHVLLFHWWPVQTACVSELQQHGRPYRGVPPVQDDLRDVVCWMQEVVIPPLVPVNGHGSVFVHAADIRAERRPVRTETLDKHKTPLTCTHGYFQGILIRQVQSDFFMSYNQNTEFLSFLFWLSKAASKRNLSKQKASGAASDTGNKQTLLLTTEQGPRFGPSWFWDQTVKRGTDRQIEIRDNYDTSQNPKMGSLRQKSSEQKSHSNEDEFRSRRIWREMMELNRWIALKWLWLEMFRNVWWWNSEADGS